MAHHEHSQDHSHHVLPFEIYLKVFGGLLILTVITVALAQVHLGPLNDAVALGVATVKALLVLGYFMGLKFDKVLNRITIGSAFFFLILLYALAQLDVLTQVTYDLHF